MDFHLLDLPRSTKANRFPRSLMVFRGHTDWISPLAISGRKLTSKLDYWELSQGRVVFSSSVFLCFREKHWRIDDGSTCFFPKQFAVGVLNATLDLAALVLVGVVGFLGSEVVLSPVVSGCLRSCGWWGVVGVAASRAKTFRNQNHRFQSKFAYCKLFGVYAGVIILYHW